MSETVGYVVVEYNQASGQPAVMHGDVWWDIEDANEQLKMAEGVTADVGRKERYAIGTLTVEEPDE